MRRPLTSGTGWNCSECAAVTDYEVPEQQLLINAAAFNMKIIFFFFHLTLSHEKNVFVSVSFQRILFGSVERLRWDGRSASSHHVPAGSV